MKSKDVLLKLFCALVFSVILIPASAVAGDVPFYDFVTPVFGLSPAPDGSLLVADYGSGVVELRKGEGNLVVPLPAVTDMAPIGNDDMFAVTGIGQVETAQKLFRASRGSLLEIADLAGLRKPM